MIAVVLLNAALVGCGAADLGVERVHLSLSRPELLARHFDRGEDLVCTYDPPQPSPLFLSPLGPGARDAEIDLQRSCPGLKRGEIPRALLSTEETVVFGLRGCRVTRIYKFASASPYALQAEPQEICTAPSRLWAHPAEPGSYPKIKEHS
jgi:hypothetical protein